MSVPRDLVGSNGLLEDIGIAVYESMTEPGAMEVRDLCAQLRKRIEEIKELRIALETSHTATSEVKTRLNGAMSYLDEAVKVSFRANHCHEREASTLHAREG